MASRYVKQEELGLGKLNNSEYLNLMTRFLKLAFPASESDDEDDGGSPSVVSAGNPELGLTEEDRAAMQADLDQLGDLVKPTLGYDETPQMTDTDKQRDDTVIYVTSSITNEQKNPIEAKRVAAASLYKVIKPYVGVSRLPNQQETVQINGMLNDLAKEENAPLVETLGLTEALNALRELNDRYSTLTEQRTNASAANEKEDSATIRDRMDTLYEEMTMMAYAQNIVNPTETSALFVSRMNAVIKEIRSLYNLRVEAREAAKKKKEEKPSEGGEEADTTVAK